MVSTAHRLPSTSQDDCKVKEFVRRAGNGVHVAEGAGSGSHGPRRIRIRTARSCTLARRDDGEGPDPETKVQVKFQNLSWEQALYNDCLDFSDVVEDVRSDIYHEKLDGHFLVGYVFSDPRIDESDQISVSALLHPPGSL